MKTTTSPFTLRFTRTFTTGTLEGITQSDTLTFSDASLAALWLKRINSPAIAKRNGYTVDAGKFAN